MGVNVWTNSLRRGCRVTDCRIVGEVQQTPQAEIKIIESKAGFQAVYAHAGTV